MAARSSFDARAGPPNVGVDRPEGDLRGGAQRRELGRVLEIERDRGETTADLFGELGDGLTIGVVERRTLRIWAPVRGITRPRAGSRPRIEIEGHPGSHVGPRAPSGLVLIDQPHRHDPDAGRPPCPRAQRDPGRARADREQVGLVAGLTLGEDPDDATAPKDPMTRRERVPVPGRRAVDGAVDGDRAGEPQQRPHGRPPQGSHREEPRVAGEGRRQQRGIHETTVVVRDHDHGTIGLEGIEP
jgi:hypothetical protein